MTVFDHVTIRVSDRDASERFYDTVLPVLLPAEPKRDDRYSEWGDFSLAPAGDSTPVTRGLHIAFAAPSRRVVDEFWNAGNRAGFEDDGAPGLRPQYGEDYYGAFLLDPDGNSVEAVHHDSVGPAGSIDHLWIRVADVPPARSFYELIAPFGRFRVGTSTPGRVQFTGERGSFSIVAGRPTEPFHLAFPASDDETVEAFHRAVTEAGYRDNGGPGERPEYHQGYYGAFVLDPDGHNIEVVNHNRG